jgi:predicted DNA-binding transcriptional regulator AlpA
MKHSRVRDNGQQVRQMISVADVLRRIPVSRSTLHRKVRDGTFPKARQIAPMRVGFFLDEVIDWQCKLRPADFKLSAADLED